jgi:hypothetical protein
VQSNRAILRITFDPMDAGNPDPPVYITSSLLSRSELKSSSGTSINGKVGKNESDLDRGTTLFHIFSIESNCILVIMASFTSMSDPTQTVAYLEKVPDPDNSSRAFTPHRI